MLSIWDELIELIYLRFSAKWSYVETYRLFCTFVGTYPPIVPFTKRALLLGVPSIIKIGVINSLFSLPESRFRFDTLDFQCLDSRSTKFLGLQLTHNLKTETTLSIFYPIHFEVSLGMVQSIQILPRYKHQFLIHQIMLFHPLKLLPRCNDPTRPFLPFFLLKN